MNLDHLAQLATEATPGRWQVDFAQADPIDGMVGWTWLLTDWTGDPILGGCELDPRDDVAFIAAANPETVLALVEAIAASKLMSKTLVELSLACEVYFDTDAELPDHDMIDGDLVHAYRDQNNWRDALAKLDNLEGTDG